MKIISKAEAAALLDVSPATLDRLTAKGQIAAYRIGGRWKYREDEIQAYFDGQRVECALPTPTRRPRAGINERVKYAPGMKII